MVHRFFHRCFLQFCFIVSFALQCHAQNYNWAKGMGGSGIEQGKAIDIDNNGNVYVAGFFNNTVDLDPGTGVANLTSAGNQDIYFARYDMFGNYLWANRIGAGSSDICYSMVADNSGNTCITGTFGITVDFDPGIGVSSLTANGTSDIFFAKYDVNGNYVWAKSIGGGSSETVKSITADGTGNIYIAGSFQGTVDFDPGTGISNLTTSAVNVFFAKYDPSGNFLWVKSIQNPTGFDAVNNMQMNTAGDILLCGYFYNTADFDPGNGTVNRVAAGARDIFFARYDPNGNLIWVDAMGGSSDDEARAATWDALGNICVTGYFQTTVDFDPGTGTANLVLPGVFPIFFGKYDSNGNYLWAKTFGGNGQACFSIATDSYNNVYLAGDFYASLDFDPGTGNTTENPSGYLEDIFFAGYNSNGNFLFVKTIGDTASDFATVIKLDASNNIYICGAFGRMPDFDPGTGTAFLNAIAKQDIFFAKYDPYLVGISEFTSDQGIRIYPDPFHETLHIDSEKEMDHVDAELYDLVGKKIASFHLSGMNTLLQTPGVAPGAYLLRIVRGAETFGQLIIKN